MKERIRLVHIIVVAVAVATLHGCTRAGSAAQATSAPPDCGGGQLGTSVPAASTTTAPAVPVPQTPQAPLFRTVTEIPLPGGAVRFDYQSLDDALGRLYISHMSAGQLVVFDTKAQRVVGVVDSLPGVTGVWAVPELGRVYGSVTGLHQVAIIDANSLRVIARVGRIAFPDGIAYAPNARKVFVSDESGGGELVIDAGTDRAAGKIPLGGEAGNTIYDPGSGCVLVAVQTRNEVVAINPKAERIVGRYAFAGADHPHGMSVDAPRRLLFVANQGNATLSIVDLRTMRVAARQPIGDDPDVLAFDPGWRRLYVASEAGVVTVFDERGDSLRRVGSVTMPHAHTVAVSPSTHTVYFPLQNVNGRPVLRVMRARSPTHRQRIVRPASRACTRRRLAHISVCLVRPLARSKNQSLVRVSVMDVRVVRMSVGERFMTVPMCVRFPRRIVRLVRMLVVRVVYVKVFVLQRLVHVQVLMPLGQVQPHADRHQRCAAGQEWGGSFVVHGHCHSRTDKRGH